MRLSDTINKIAELPMLPISVTERSKHKAVRVIGVLVYVFWFLPALLVWIFVAGLLAIPAMIQDA